MARIGEKVPEIAAPRADCGLECPNPEPDSVERRQQR